MAGSAYEFKERAVIPFDKAVAWQTAVYSAVGMSGEDARVVAENMVTADLRGVYSHGIIRTPVYVGHLKSGNINPTARPEVLRRSAASALVDGHNAMGMVVGEFANDLAIEMAREAGSATVSVTGSNHLGTCAHYVEKAAGADMIGIFWAMSGANNMAPWGGVDPQLSNNPFAIGAPRKSGAPLVIDMASSVVAKGKLLVAAKAGTSIPEGWALDSGGKPTTDPQAALNGGTLLPLAGYKGAGLSFMIAVITAVLNNSKYGPFMADMYKKQDEHLNSGHLAQAIDIASIADVEEFKLRMDGMVDYIKGGARAEGVEELFVPGEPEALTRVRQLANGISYPVTVIEEIDAVTREYGITAPV